MKRRGPQLSTLYSALSQLSSMRATVGSLAGDLAETESARLLARLEVAEWTALLLIECVEARRKLWAH